MSPALPLSISVLLRRALALAAYGVAFEELHHLAALWGRDSAFSLWFPAAGLRFAAMWSLPPQWIPVIALTEAAANALTGNLGNPIDMLALFGTLNAPLCYGLAIVLVRRYLSSRRSGLSTPPMPLGIAMVLAPIVAVLGSLPWAMSYGPHEGGPISLKAALSEAGIYWIGDLLGIWMIAPPLLWLRAWRPRRVRLAMTPRHWEALVVVALGWTIAGLIGHFSGAVHVEPVLLSAVWVALRLGRMAAWIVGALATLVILMVTGPATGLEARANLHLFAASFSIAAYLVGSYAEAERETLRDLERAQRLLLRADRLKSLRAMSLAAIHDISQPLSTIGLEARYVREMAAQPEFDRAEMIATSQLIERKTNHLAELVRRMRLFGSDSGANHGPVRIGALLADVAALTRSEAEAAGVLLRVMPTEALETFGSEVELQQAMVNLVRNAIAAAPGGTVLLRARDAEDAVLLEVIDDGGGAATTVGVGVDIGAGAATGAGLGMGLGLIIARTIVEAHGGQLRVAGLAPCGSCYALSLPRRTQP
jgi:signal transduction histidine kinase